MPRKRMSEHVIRHLNRFDTTQNRIRVRRRFEIVFVSIIRFPVCLHSRYELAAAVCGES